jgi:hypothetical protein
MLGNLAISVICGTVYGITAVVLGLPYPLAIAVIAGVLDLVPSVEATVAGVVIAIYQQGRELRPAAHDHWQVSGFTVLASVLAFGADWWAW